MVTIGHECDLAILTVSDPAFWVNLQPLSLGLDLPQLQDQVAVVGISDNNLCSLSLSLFVFDPCQSLLITAKPMNRRDV